MINRFSKFLVFDLELFTKLSQTSREEP